jgi:hypothetical protein
MEKNRGDEPVWVIIHIYMEISQGNSRCSYLKQIKMPFSFSFTKSKNRRAKQVLSGGLVPVGREKSWGKGVGRRL